MDLFHGMQSPGFQTWKLAKKVTTRISFSLFSSFREYSNHEDPAMKYLSKDLNHTPT